MERGSRRGKSPADLVGGGGGGGGVLGCRGFHSIFRTTQGPTRPWIIYSDSAQTMQSLV